MEANAKRALKALAEVAMAEYAIRAAESAVVREENAVDAECVACGAARAAIRAV